MEVSLLNLYPAGNVRTGITAPRTEVSTSSSPEDVRSALQVWASARFMFPSTRRLKGDGEFNAMLPESARFVSGACETSAIHADYRLGQGRADRTLVLQHEVAQSPIGKFSLRRR